MFFVEVLESMDKNYSRTLLGTSTTVFGRVPRFREHCRRSVPYHSAELQGCECDRSKVPCRADEIKHKFPTSQMPKTPSKNCEKGDMFCSREIMTQ